MTAALFPDENYSSMYLITGEPANNPDKFLGLLAAALAKGIKLVQLRAKSLALPQYAALATAAVALCHQFQAKALVHNYFELLEETNADGVHFSSAYLSQFKQRPIPKNLIMTAACHNTVQMHHATVLGADCLTLSPIFTTPSCPQGQALGWQKFANLLTLTKLPVFALGGMTPSMLGVAREHGAIGIAGIRSLWEGNDI